jgi:hypothetical protein
MELVARRLGAPFIALLIGFSMSMLLGRLAMAQAPSTNPAQMAGGTSVIKDATGVESTLVTYPSIEGLLTSPDFTVKVNGVAVWTERVGAEGMESMNVANFSCAGPQTITITSSANISNYVIRPKARGIAAKVSGKTLTFTIPGPQKLYIEIDQLPHLAIFANPLEVNPPKDGDPGVTYYGPGVHNVQNITLQSDQTIYIAGGAVVNARVSANNASHAKIIGRGLLTAAGGVRITGGDDVLIEGIFIRHPGGGWVNTITSTTNCTYRNTKVFSYGGVWGTDGIDPQSCQNFTIDDCFLRCRDDCVSIKGGRGGASVTDNVKVLNSIMVGWGHADGVTIGFDVSAETRNVLVKNCDILYARGQGHTGGHAAFSIVADSRGFLENIRYEDIRVEENVEFKNLELIVTEGTTYGRPRGTPAHIKGVYLKNITWEADKPMVIAGVPSLPGEQPDAYIVEDVTFENCRVAGKLLTSLEDANFQVEFAKNIKFIPSTQPANAKP